MNLTTRQQSILQKIQLFDNEWDEKSFAKVWNNILNLSKYVSVSQGKLLLELSDPNYATIIVKKDDKILLQEKIYWNEYIKMDEEKSEVKEIASSIKNLAERLMIS
jgi:hypothetical protein